MGHIVKRPAGTFRANWRDPAGRQRAKTFKTRREAKAFLAETEGTVNRGSYVDPHAGRTQFGDYARRWMAARSTQINRRPRPFRYAHARLAAIGCRTAGQDRPPGDPGVVQRPEPKALTLCRRSAIS